MTKFDHEGSAPGKPYDEWRASIAAFCALAPASDRARGLSSERFDASAITRSVGAYGEGLGRRDLC